MPGTAAFSTRKVTRMKPRRLSPPGSEMMVSRFLQGRPAEQPSAWGSGGLLVGVSPHAPGNAEPSEQNPPGSKSSHLHPGRRGAGTEQKGMGLLWFGGSCDPPHGLTGLTVWPVGARLCMGSSSPRFSRSHGALLLLQWHLCAKG